MTGRGIRIHWLRSAPMTVRGKRFQSGDPAGDPADRRCAAARGSGECWARARLRGFSGWLPIWCVTYGAVPTWKAQPRLPYGWPVPHLVSPPSPAPSLRSIRPADRRAGGVRCGGGRKGPRRVLGSWLADEAFQGACPICWVTQGAVPT